jgi:hypothetical protein
MEVNDKRAEEDTDWMITIFNYMCGVIIGIMKGKDRLKS